MRFDPDHVLRPSLEYYDWRPALWPAGARSWRFRRMLGRCVDAVGIALTVLAAGTFCLANTVHGQPQVSTRVNFAADPPRRLNRYTDTLVAPPERLPFADADLDFLAGFLVRQPEAARALDPELLAAVRERQGGAR